MARRAKSEGSDCQCAGCTGTGDPHPVYGYDRSRVPGVRCLHCDEPIGDERYVEITMIARFGTMYFAHERCSPDPKASAVPACFRGKARFAK